MVVEFKDNNCFCGVKDIFIEDGKKLLKIFYGANADLDFDIFGSCNKNEMAFVQLFLTSNNMKKFINILNSL